MSEQQQTELRAYGEDQAAVTLVDFVDLWTRWRAPFLIGLLIVAVVTVGWIKLVRKEFFRAETTFSVGSQFTSISRVGVADLQLFEANRSDKLLVQQIIQAEQWLRSRDLLMEAVEAVKQPAEPDHQRAWDVAGLLGITEQDPSTRQAILTKTLVDDLTRVTQIQNSGVIRLGVELPDPAAAAALANACVHVLQERFTDADFRYLDQAVALYEDDLRTQLAERGKLADEQLALGPFDTNPTVQSRRSSIQEQLDLQAEALGTLRVNIEHLRIATDERARAAAQPVTVIDKAWPPLNKSRPKTILSTILALAVYTFVFMIGLVAIGLARAVARRRPTAE
jgi:uncharacterized protein involved in exopolysaccharide biosynthesis